MFSRVSAGAIFILPCRRLAAREWVSGRVGGGVQHQPPKSALVHLSEWAQPLAGIPKLLISRCPLDPRRRQPVCSVSGCMVGGLSWAHLALCKAEMDDQDW